MSTKTIMIVTCDVCKVEIKDIEKAKVNFPVIFHTEQDEGRPTEPYISYEKLDLCDKCKAKLLRLHGHGAQGFNKYAIEGA